MDERERLLSAIAADPDAVENWIVYADWLTEHDDPRGELIVCEIAREDERTSSGSVIERHRELMQDPTVWLSPQLAVHVEDFELRMWRGCIRSAEVLRPTSENISALLADPHACLLQKLKLGPDVQAFEPRRMPWVREIEIHSVEATELPLAEAFPALERMLVGDAQLDVLAHPRLRVLTGHVSALETGRFDLPSLEELRDANVATLFGDAGILRNPPTGLRELRVGYVTADILEMLRASPVLANLKVLGVGIFDAASIDALAQDPSPFRRVDVRYLAVQPDVQIGDPENIDADIAAAYMAACEALMARITAVLPNARRNFGEEARRPEIEPAVTQKIGDTFAKFGERLKARLQKP